jgi:plastocyanin
MIRALVLLLLGLHPVRIDNNVYEPRELHVRAGDTVVWVAGGAGHTVTADDASFDFYPDRTLSRGDAAAFTFDTPGTFPYYCRTHGLPGGYGMSARVVVDG